MRTFRTPYALLHSNLARNRSISSISSSGSPNETRRARRDPRPLRGHLGSRPGARPAARAERCPFGAGQATSAIRTASVHPDSRCGSPPSQEAHPKVRGQTKVCGREPRPASPLRLTTGDLARELTTRVVTGTNNSRAAKVAETRRGENRSQTAAGPPRDTFGRSASRSARNSHLPARLQLRGWDSNPQPTD
jgi:hypothetical protein